MYGNGGCAPSPADVLEPAAISGSLGEDLREAATRSAGTALEAATGSAGRRGVGGGGASRHYCDPLYIGLGL
jgi:hypothetical protein